MSDATRIVKPGGPLPLKNVQSFIELCMLVIDRPWGTPNIGVMYGHSGYGKSQSAIYARNKLNAIIIEAGGGWDRKKLPCAILREAGAGEPKGKISDLIDMAVEVLAENPRRPLVIDEMDVLVEKNMLDLIKQIVDQSQAPVILIGEEKLPVKLARDEHFHNRVRKWVPAQPCDLEDCKKLAKSFLTHACASDALLEMARQAGEGRARRIVTTLGEMNEFARNNGVKELTPENYKGEIFSGVAPKPRSGKLTIVGGGRAA